MKNHLEKASIIRCYYHFFNRLLWSVRPLITFGKGSVVAALLSMWRWVHMVGHGIVAMFCILVVLICMFLMAPFGYTTRVLYDAEDAVKEL